jgi:hypothetical protein
MVDYEETVAFCVWHAWWTSSNDPFYLHNPGPIRQRISYYQLTWVPDVMINGAGAGYPGGPDPLVYSSMASFIDSCLAVESPLEIMCSGMGAGSGVYIGIDVTVETPQPPGDYRLYAALVEKHIYLPSPNGETDHYSTFRWINNNDGDPTGVPIDLTSAGVQHFEYVFPMYECYQTDQMAASVWVQDYATTNVLQAGKADVPIPYYVTLVHDGPPSQIGGGGDVVHFAGTITNRGGTDDLYELTVNGVPAGWSYSYTTPQGTFSGPSTLPLLAGENAGITLDLDSHGNPGWATVTLTAASQHEPRNFASIDFKKLNGLEVLLVDADGGEQREAYAAASLDSAGARWDLWDKSWGDLTSSDLDNAASSVVWMCGNTLPNLSAGDRGALGAYLDGGGNLFLSGTDVSYQLASPQSPYRTAETEQWYHQYLHAIHGTDWNTTWQLTGTPGDPIGHGLAPVLSNVPPNDQRLPDGIYPGPGSGVVFTYLSPYDAGIKWTDGNTHVLFFGFGFEGMIDESDRITVIERTLDWFGSTTGARDPGHTPAIPALTQNMPNPFGLATWIKYTPRSTGPVRLRVYDMNGRIVRNLVDSHQDKTAQSAVWDGTDDQGRDLASGVYFYRLESDGAVETRRMVLSR